MRSRSHSVQLHPTEPVEGSESDHYFETIGVLVFGNIPGTDAKIRGVLQIGGPMTGLTDGKLHRSEHERVGRSDRAEECRKHNLLHSRIGIRVFRFRHETGTPVYRG